MNKSVVILSVIKARLAGPSSSGVIFNSSQMEIMLAILQLLAFTRLFAVMYWKVNSALVLLKPFGLCYLDLLIEFYF